MATLKQRQMSDLAHWRREKYTHPELRFLFVEMTQQCNERCLHCGSRCDSSKSPEVPADTLVSILSDVAQRIDISKTMLCVTGGEPLLRRDFFDLMKRLSRIGYQWGMTTNGTLISPEVARRLAECKMSTISVSVDGLESTHDRFRCSPGSFRKAIEGVQNLLDVGAFSHVQITTVVHKWNIGELDEMLDEFDKLDIDSWRLACIEPIGRALENPELMLDGDDLRTLMNFIHDKRRLGYPIDYGCCHYLGEALEHEVRDAYFLCNAGICIASIMANGDIGSCLDIERRPETIMGNVYEDDFLDVWNKRFDPLRRELAELDATCQGCPEREFCAGGSWHSFDFDKRHQRICMKGTLF